MLNKPSRTLLATAIMSSLGVSNYVYAEQSAQTEVEEIVVQGYRNSLLKAKDLKRNAVGAQDSIVAEDIAEQGSSLNVPVHFQIMNSGYHVKSSLLRC